MTGYEIRMTRVTFTVYGTPQPGGSKRAFVIAGRARITDANAKAKPWKQEVARVALQAMNGQTVLQGPLCLKVTFYRPRPKGHYKGNGLWLNATGMRTPYPATKPDSSKLVRSTEDALTGIIWRDDAQVVVQEVRKEWGEPARAEVEVTQL